VPAAINHSSFIVFGRLLFKRLAIPEAYFMHAQIIDGLIRGQQMFWSFIINSSEWEAGRASDQRFGASLYFIAMKSNVAITDLSLISSYQIQFLILAYKSLLKHNVIIVRAYQRHWPVPSTFFEC